MVRQQNEQRRERILAMVTEAEHGITAGDIGAMIGADVRIVSKVLNRLADKRLIGTTGRMLEARWTTYPRVDALKDAIMAGRAGTAHEAKLRARRYARQRYRARVQMLKVSGGERLDGWTYRPAVEMPACVRGPRSVFELHLWETA